MKIKAIFLHLSAEDRLKYHTARGQKLLFSPVVLHKYICVSHQ